jgi:hypothetical protein
VELYHEQFRGMLVAAVGGPRMTPWRDGEKQRSRRLNRGTHCQCRFRRASPAESRSLVGHGRLSVVVPPGKARRKRPVRSGMNKACLNQPPASIPPQGMAEK